MSRSWRFALGILAACGCVGATGPEDASPLVPPALHPVTATAIAEHASIQPGGSTRVGVYFEIEEGWHIYAQDPGDAGLPTKVTWSSSEGFSLGPLQWPEPTAFVDPGDIQTFGYEREVVLASRLTVDSNYRGGLFLHWDLLTWVSEVPVHAKVSWLACREICIPGKVDLDLVLPLSPDPPVPSTHAHFFHSTTEAQ